MSLGALEAALQPHGLTALGGFHPTPEDNLPEAATLVLIGPAAHGFWPRVTAQPEFADGAADPLDRWSRRALAEVADSFEAKAYFPFDGPPWHPFPAWAVRSGWAWVSPVGLLVHADAGLWVAYRGALALPNAIDLPHRPPSPCVACLDQPCRTACPVDALGSGEYDVHACHDHLDTAPGAKCMEGGCRVRAACPASQAWGRNPSQSAFHMRAFHT